MFQRVIRCWCSGNQEAAWSWRCVHPQQAEASHQEGQEEGSKEGVPRILLQKQGQGERRKNIVKKHCKDCKLRIGKNMECAALPSRCFHSVTYLHVHFHCDKFGQYQTGEDIEC